jgi:hypothetical protein
LAFGDADSYLRDLEKQIEFRDRQLSKLTLKCSLMQLDLESDTGKKVDEAPKPKPREKKLKERSRSKKRPTKKVEEPVQIVEASSAESEEQQQESSSSSSFVQEATETTEQPTQPNRRRQFSALELIKLFDDEEIDDKSINDLNLLSSLFIELKRLNQVNFHVS